MNILIEARSFELTEAISNRVEKMVQKALEKYDIDIPKVSVVLDYAKHRKGGQPSADVTIKIEIKGPDIVAQNQHDDLYEAVDYALDRVVDQIQKRKEM